VVLDVILDDGSTSLEVRVRVLGAAVVDTVAVLVLRLEEPHHLPNGIPKQSQLPNGGDTHHNQALLVVNIAEVQIELRSEAMRSEATK
jgi:hypothetical protein